MNDNYIKENSMVYKSYLQRNWFTSWKMPRGEDLNFLSSIEIYLTTDCNLGCTYCYLNRHEDSLYSPEIREFSSIINNLDILLNWLIENKFTPKLELFSGSAVESELGFAALDLIYNKYKDLPLEIRPPEIVVPTNYTFLLSDDLTKKIEDYLQKFKEIEMPIFLSASIDGKYLEDINRPYRSFERILKSKSGLYLPDKPRDDEFYHKLFKFNIKYNFGFHPMVYSNHIELWKQNFLWFQEMFDQYNISFDSIYLLEIRNQEWSEEQLDQYEDFLSFLIKWTWDKVDRNVEDFKTFLFDRKGYNMLTNSLYTKGRGTGCALQTSLYVRMGDLAIVGCHRQSYDGYEFAKFIVEDNKIIDIEAINLEFALATAQLDSKFIPYCEKCALNKICMGSCMGASLEYLGEAFTPIPTVCELVYRKTYRMIKVFQEIGIYNDIYEYLGNDQQEAFDYVLKEIENEF